MRYHLRETRLVGQRYLEQYFILLLNFFLINFRPANKEEHFNLHHATLHTIIERMFSVLKRCFRIILQASEYAFRKQVKLVYAITALHNFITGLEGEEILIMKMSFLMLKKKKKILLILQFSSECLEMQAKRNEIAQKMWDDYVNIQRN